MLSEGECYSVGGWKLVGRGVGQGKNGTRRGLKFSTRSLESGFEIFEFEITKQGKEQTIISVFRTEPSLIQSIPAPRSLLFFLLG